MISSFKHWLLTGFKFLLFLVKEMILVDGSLLITLCDVVELVLAIWVSLEEFGQQIYEKLLVITKENHFKLFYHSNTHYSQFSSHYYSYETR